MRLKPKQTTKHLVLPASHSTIMKNPISTDKYFYLRNIRFPVFWQMLLAMTFVLCFSIGALWAYLQINFNELLQQQVDTFATTITRQTANSSAEMLMAEDYLALSSMLENMVHSSDNIHSIFIQDNIGKTVALAVKNQVEAESKNEELNNVYQANIFFHKIKAGAIQLSIDNSAISDSLTKALRALGLILTAIFSLAIITSILLAKKITRSLQQLQTTTKEVALGNLYPELPRSNNNEIGDLVKSFELMLKGLRDKESIEKSFYSFISKDIAKDILSDLEQPKKPLKNVSGSVLFVDIVGFTQLSEKHPPQEIADLLNQYYSLIHQVSKIYWGSVDNFIGDGAMITFGVHIDDNKHSINAICAATLFIHLSKALNHHRKNNQQPEINFRLGLHCGDMLAGAIGDQERMQFTISGDTVNVAARLCDLANPNTLMISESIFKHHACDSLLITEDSQLLNVKGKLHPVKCYNVVGLEPQLNRLLMQQEQELTTILKYV